MSTRYASLLSQLHNISATLTSASPSYLSDQQAKLSNELATEAKAENLYEGLAVGSLVGTDTYQSGQIAVEGRDSGIHKVPALNALPKVYAVDSNNALPTLSVHPVLPIPDDEKTLALHGTLRTRFEPALEADLDQIADQELFRVAESSTGRRGALIGGANKGISKETASMAALEAAYGLGSEEQLIALVKREKDRHDNVVRTAQRMWAHIERAPDQWGEGYDWKMRVTEDLDEDLGAASEEGMGQVEEMGGEEGNGDHDLFGSPSSGEGEAPGNGDDADGDEYIGDAFDKSMDDETPAAT